MDEHVLAASIRLDEPISLGWVEPFHRAFSHSRVSAAIETIANRRIPDAGMCRRATEYAGCAKLGRSNDSRNRENFPAFCAPTPLTPCFLAIFAPEPAALRH